MDKLNVGQTVLHIRFCSFSNVPKYYFGEPAHTFGMHTFHGKPDSISTKKKRSLRRKTSHHSRHRPPPPPPFCCWGGGGGGGVKPKIMYALRRGGIWCILHRYLQQWHGGILTCIYSVTHYLSSGSRHHSSLCVAVKTACCPCKGKSLAPLGLTVPRSFHRRVETHLGAGGWGGGW